MPKPSPEQAALLVTEGIFENLNALTKSENPPKDEIDTRNAQLSRLTDRGAEILVEQGFQPELREMVEKTDDYFQRLLMRSMTSRFLDQFGPEDADPLVHRVMKEVSDSTKKEPLSPPNLQDFVHRIREPFGSLMGAIGVVHTLTWRTRYATARDAGNALLGLNDPKPRSSHS